MTVEPALGTRAIVVPAIEKGQINLEPDYAASLLGFLHGGNAAASGRQHRHRHPRRPEGARLLRRDRAARVEGARHQRVRRHQGHRHQGPPHDHFEPEALRVAS